MNRARWACAASCAAGFFTLPLYPLVITLGYVFGGERAAGETGPLGMEWLSETTMWASAAGLLLALTGFALGWLHRRDLEVKGAQPHKDDGLARAGELLGAGVTLLALFLLIGTVMQAQSRAAVRSAAAAAPPGDQPSSSK